MGGTTQGDSRDLGGEWETLAGVEIRRADSEDLKPEEACTGKVAGVLMISFGYRLRVREGNGRVV
jgi:hypothetical protein